MLGTKLGLKPGSTDALTRFTIRELQCRPRATPKQREEILETWCRQQLRTIAAPLIERWEGAIGVRAEDWRIRKMKTKLGSCNTSRAASGSTSNSPANRSVLSSTSSSTSSFISRGDHGAVFQELMERHLPDWRSRRTELGILPLGH